MNPQQIVIDALQSVSFGSAAECENLAVLPLLAREEREPDYLTLDEALAEGSLQIEEISEAGAVPELRVINRATKGVLLVDGEELIGAKQNRIINLSVLVPAGKTMVIPHVTAALASTGRRFPAVGDGEDVRLSDLFIVGAALVAGGRAIHVSAFPVPAEGR